MTVYTIWPRTLEPKDEEFHACYGGEMIKRDLAYHQGTVWTFPMGGYYLAYLKVNKIQKKQKIKLSGSMWIKPFHVKVIVWMK